MFSPDRSTLNQLTALNSVWGFRHRGGDVFCDIHDKTTKHIYATGEGPTEAEAIKAALAKAQVSERPKTPSELLVERNTLADKNRSLAEQNKELLARIAAIETGDPPKVVKDPTLTKDPPADPPPPPTEEDEERQQLKELLTNARVKFHHNHGLTKLRELAKENGLIE